MKTVFVTGCNGLLGTKLCQLIPTTYRLIGFDVHDTSQIKHQGFIYIQGDITSCKKVNQQIMRYQPGVIFHTAAITNVDECELQKDLAWDVNVGGTENLILPCKEINCKFVHVSTDYVFDGENGPYSENDIPNPISVYGKTKLESENIVHKMLDDSVIARTMVLYGYSPGARPNFVTWIIEKLRSKESVRIVTDQYGTPTLADDLACALWILYEQNATGIYHTAGREWINRYDFALNIAEIFKLDKFMISKTTSDQFQQIAPRPLKSGLKTERIVNELEVHFSGTREGIKIIKKQMESKVYD